MPNTASGIFSKLGTYYSNGNKKTDYYVDDRIRHITIFQTKKKGFKVHRFFELMNW